MTCILSTGFLILGLTLPAHAQLSPPLFELPAPTGKLPIGTTRWVVTDASRDETFAPGRKRDVEVVAWYPRTDGTGDTAPYVRDSMEEVLSFARLAKLGEAFNRLASVSTHAIIDAEPPRTPARVPVIVFQHGYTGLPSSHTALMEDLASHGWAVLNLIHPCEATGARLADGSIVTFTDEKNAMRAGIMDVLGEWTAEGPLRERGAYGKLDAVRAAGITRTVMREFFAQEILKQPSALLSGKQPMTGVTVVQVKQ
ncbi:MAG: hypothetical protein FJW22_01835 [Acidimicrobiia bacterium]|nr:hypothetical protein [Acidimicrobiia bacterium]